MLREVAGDGVDLLLPRGGRLDVAAQQVDLGAGQVHEPVVVAGRPGGQRVDQCRRLGRAPLGQQRLGRVGGQEGGTKPAGQAGLAGGVQAAQRHLFRAGEVAHHQQVSLSAMASISRAAPSPAASASRPRPVKDGEPLLGSAPRQERVVCEVCQDAGDHGGGAAPLRRSPAPGSGQ